MKAAIIEEPATIWFANEIPVRMFYAGFRWRVTDTPTRLRDSIWSVPLDGPRHGLYGWRFQGTAEDDGETLVFDVYKGPDGWRVHHVYE